MTIWAWGDNELATLGLGHKGRVVLSPVETLYGWLDVARLTASASHTAALFTDGHAEVVGGNVYGAACCGDKNPVKANPVRCKLPKLAAFALPESHGVAITTNGTVVTWGGNIYGQLGIGSWSEGRELLAMPGCTAEAQSPPVDGLAVVGGGQYHDLAITTRGQLVAWGDNRNGQVGDGTRKVKLAPVHLAHLSTPVVAIAGGGEHSLALHADGTVVGWGRTRYGELGQPTLTPLVRPTPIAGLSGIKAISAGGPGSLFLTDAGTVLECGHEHGLRVVGLPGPCTAISKGTVHALAICDGEVFAWGKNEWGQLGDGTRYIGRPTPVGLGIGATEVAAGVIHSLARAG